MKLPQSILDILELNRQTEIDKNFKLGNDGIYHLDINPIICWSANKKIDVNETVKIAGDYILKYLNKVDVLFVECVGMIMDDIGLYVEHKLCNRIGIVCGSDIDGTIFYKPEYKGHKVLTLDSDYEIINDRIKLRRR